MKYEIRWKRSAERDLRSIDRQQVARIISAVESLAGNPFPPGLRKLRGAEQLYRIRVGDYRVIYEIETKSRILTIFYVRHRREAYRKV
ncbi:MAG: type II toxin-antitoxin system RelE/ParE family toxin [Candidatus Atabeyarchaeum deiterrae]